MDIQSTKHELQKIIQGDGRQGGGGLVQAICGHLGRGQGAGETASGPKRPKQEEERWLTPYITRASLWLPPPDEGLFLAAGAEQRVFLAPGGVRVLKVNSGVFYASWQDYFHNLLLHNYFFPATAYECIGFVEGGGRLSAVVSQPYVRAEGPTDLAAVREFLEGNGFVNTRNNDYLHHGLGIILEDLHDENVLAKGDILFFIDTAFYLTDHFWR
jgi:hypothetical protein